MVYYFNQVQLQEEEAKIAYAIQWIQKGKNNCAGNWANSKIHKMSRYADEGLLFQATYPGRTFDFSLAKTTHPAIAAVAPVEDGTSRHPEWLPYKLLKMRPSVAATDYKCCSSCLTL